MKVTQITTTYENSQAETREIHGEFQPDSRNEENHLLNLYPTVTYQKFLGFGGALTEASGYTLSRMDDSVYDAVLDAYYGKDGLNYQFGRTHLDSCDFALGNYSAVTDPEDTEFKSFSLERAEKYVLPLIRGAAKKNPALSLMVTPWSPPAFMKTNNEQNHGGKLLPQYRQQYARYLCRQLSEYRALGFQISMMSIQNEQNAVQTWDSCLFTASEEGEFIRDYLAPEMKRQGLEGIDILLWDHNKERAFERMQQTMSAPGMDPLVGGIAFHWYSGDHFESLNILREQYPGKRLVFSEGCVELSKFAGAGQLKGAQMYAHEIMGDLNHGMDTFLDWNIVLDEQGGPNHVANYCDAPVICDTVAGTWEKKLSYHYIGHFSRYLQPGAVRLGMSLYTDRLEATAFRNPDGTTVVVAMNRQTEALPLTLRLNGMLYQTTLPAQSIATYLFETEGA